MVVLVGKMGKCGAMLTQRTRSYFWGLLTLCHFWRRSIKKCDCESADEQTDIRCNRNKTEFITCPMLYAIAMWPIVMVKLH